MKKFYYFLATLLCFPYFSMFVWSPADISDFTTSHLLSAQESTSSDASVPYYLKKIGADDTADTLAGYPIKDTVVAIIDTGAELSHEDLADSLWVNDAERNGTDNIDDDGNGFIDDVYGVDFVNNVPTPVPDDSSAPLRYDAPEDDSNSSHGTHVSGIVGMNPENESGSVGVGYHTKIMILKAGNSKNSFSFSNATKAVKYAVANGADVINMSFGSYNQNDLFASELEEASHSCLLVAAAGNNGKASSVSLMYPAAYPYV
ncbi:MAG: S8 family serine peptidase, partial [Eubacterium sp.]